VAGFGIPEREAGAAAFGGSQISSKENLPSCRPGSWLCGSGSSDCITLGVSRKTLQNQLANLKAAIRQFSSVERMSGRAVPLNAAWQALYDKLSVPRLRLGLAGFLRYCSANGVEPSSVSDATVRASSHWRRSSIWWGMTLKPKPSDCRLHAMDIA
jgi:hypothetical protein